MPVDIVMSGHVLVKLSTWRWFFEFCITDEEVNYNCTLIRVLFKGP